MFNEKERRIIRRDFFSISMEGASVVELQSQNGDWWMLLEVQETLSRRQMARRKPKVIVYRLMHKHANYSLYHEHVEYTSVLDAILEVINHDDYRLKNKGKTHFDELLDEVNCGFSVN